ncbi:MULTISPECIES: hypothetical protein [Actinomyces]|uniref:Uncharacterized protein n=1 Tax=Actinomyces oris TaxID=544580 RepID=A0A1Q8VPX7_9ACTO|nr:hypothetical protein [Actinomyces oris]OLO50147.1 hypothetical protein BKH28_04830 [Actinomyces oris]
MAIYARSRPTTGIKALGCLGALAAVGLSVLYPLVLFGASWPLGKVDEALMADPSEPSRAVTPASHLITWTTLYSFMLTALCFGAAFCFVGIDQWLTKDAMMSHRDVMAARFLHVTQEPSRRTAGLLWAMLAGTLLVACPIALMAVPNVLSYIGIYTEIYIEPTRELVDGATLILLLLHILLFVAMVRAAVRRRSSAVRLRSYGMAVADPKSFSLPLPSDRDDLRVQEIPTRRGRVQIQAVYSPPTKGTEPSRPVLLPRLSLTVKPSRLDDARSQVEARLDEVWHASQLIRTSTEQDEATPAPTAQPEPKPA